MEPPASVVRNSAKFGEMSGIRSARSVVFSPTNCRVASSIDMPEPRRGQSAYQRVSTQPGQIALQVICDLAFSSAVTLVSPMMPCLDATYALC